MGKKLAAVIAIAVVGVIVMAAGEEFEPKTWNDFLQYAFQIVVPLAAAVMVGFKHPKELLQKKTTWTGISIIVGAVAALSSGSIDLPTAMYAVVAGLAVIFLRDGMVAVEKQQEAIKQKQEEILKATEMAASKERVRGI